MSHRLIIALRCDHRDDVGQCLSFVLGSPSMDIAAVREQARGTGWTFTPGQPYEHIGGVDRCPMHQQASSAADAATPPGDASGVESGGRS